MDKRVQPDGLDAGTTCRLPVAHSKVGIGFAELCDSYSAESELTRSAVIFLGRAMREMAQRGVPRCAPERFGDPCAVGSPRCLRCSSLG